MYCDLLRPRSEPLRAEISLHGEGLTRADKKADTVGLIGLKATDAGETLTQPSEGSMS